MQTLLDWWLALDPTWAFLTLLPFGVALVGVLSDRPARQRRSQRGRDRHPERLRPTSPASR